LADDDFHGSKPIIVPLGSSTVEEEVEVVQTEMTIGDEDEMCPMDKEAIAAITSALALEYGVDPLLISFPDPCPDAARRRRAQSFGSVVRSRARARRRLAALTLTITIATSATAEDGTVITAPSADDLLSTVSEISDSTLGAALGAVLNVTVNVTSSEPVRAVETRFVEQSCPKGYWCTAGEEVACEVGTYQPNENVDSAQACLPCMANAKTAAAAATSLSDCTCSVELGFIEVLSEVGDRTCVCPEGHTPNEMTPPRCVPCEIGLFKDQTGNQRCSSCSSDATTLAVGTKEAIDCVCLAGLYDTDADKETLSCAVCPHGTDCTTAGLETTTLRLLPGRWRALNTTSVIRLCYTQSFCPNDNGTMHCAEGHSGPFCDVCLPGYHSSTAGGCASCTGSLVLAVAIPASMLAGFILLVLCFCLVRHRRQTSRQYLLKKSMNAIAAAHQEGIADIEDLTDELVDGTATRAGKGQGQGGSVAVKARIIISLVQVINGVGVSFDIRWPPFYAVLMRWLSAIELDLPAVMPLGCLFPVDFHMSLVVQTAGPLLLSTLFGFLSYLLHRVGQKEEAQRRKQRKRLIRRSVAQGRKTVSIEDAQVWSRATASHLSSRCLDAIFLILFLVYPGAIAKIFAAFQCIHLPEAGKSYLRTDFGIDCSSVSNKIMQLGYALPMMAFYPIGVPLLLLLVLWRNRERINYWRSQEVDALSAETRVSLGLPDPREESSRPSVHEIRQRARKDRAIPPYIHRITAGYSRQYAMWEFFEMLRKLLLVGIAVVFPPGEMAQTIYGLLVCFVSFGLYMLCQPYEERGEDILAQLCQLQIFVSLIAAVALKNPDTAQGIDGMLTALTFTPITLAVLLETPLMGWSKRLLMFARQRTWRMADSSAAASREGASRNEDCDPQADVVASEMEGRMGERRSEPVAAEVEASRGNLRKGSCVDAITTETLTDDGKLLSAVLEALLKTRQSLGQGASQSDLQAIANAEAELNDADSDSDLFVCLMGWLRGGSTAMHTASLTRPNNRSSHLGERRRSHLGEASLPMQHEWNVRNKDHQRHGEHEGPPSRRTLRSSAAPSTRTLRPSSHPRLPLHNASRPSGTAVSSIHSIHQSALPLRVITERDAHAPSVPPSPSQLPPPSVRGTSTSNEMAEGSTRMPGVNKAIVGGASGSVLETFGAASVQLSRRLSVMAQSLMLR
jgi:hypothetical protein